MVRIRPAILVTLVACLAACLAAGLVACTDRGVERLTAIKRGVCACKDTGCADQAMSEVPKASIRSTPRTQAIARDIMDCRARLEAAERPSTDPDAEVDGDGSAAAAGSAPASAPPQVAPAPAAPKVAPAPAAPAPAPPKAAP
jgi:hypothetical protein